MTPPFAGIVSLAVTLTTGGGIVAAAADATSDPSNVAPYVGGGAGVIAVMALGEVTRRLLNGRLIPRETRDVEMEMSAAIQAAGQREALAMAELEAMRKAMGAVADEAAAMRRATENVTGELAALRMRIERTTS